MEDCTFANGDYTGVEDGDDDNFLSDDLGWYQWTIIGYDGGVPRTPMNDDYNVRYRFKQRVTENFYTII